MKKLVAIFLICLPQLLCAEIPLDLDLIVRQATFLRGPGKYSLNPGIDITIVSADLSRSKDSITSYFLKRESLKLTGLYLKTVKQEDLTDRLIDSVDIIMDELFKKGPVPKICKKFKISETEQLDENLCKKVIRNIFEPIKNLKLPSLLFIASGEDGMKEFKKIIIHVRSVIVKDKFLRVEL